MACATASLVAELDHIRKVYGSGDTAVAALDDLCLTVRRGEYLAVMGTSGSGKSTAMNILGCLDRPSSGSYRLNGTAVENLSDDQLADLRNRELGFVFQQFHLLQELTALENVAFPLLLAGWPRRARLARAAELLERVGLEARLHHLPSRLSGGEQQRVALARALALDPPILFADEPTGNLDLEAREQVADLLFSLGKARTLVLVTHDLELAQRAGRILHLKGGRLVREETPKAKG